MGILRQYNPMLHKLNSVSSKIIFPYLLLTLIVAGVGAYVVTNLATSSLRERFDNQLLDAGRIVSESIVESEEEQIRVHRTVTFTDGLAGALVERDVAELEAIVPPLAINNNVDLVSILDLDGLEIFGWQRSPGSDVGLNTTLNDFSTFRDVAFVLSGQSDNLGDKRVVLAELNGQLIVFTVGPVLVNDEVAGAVVIGDYLDDMVDELTARAIARVTFYDPQGEVLASSLSNDFDLLAEEEGFYDEVSQLLASTPEQVKVVIESAEESVPLRELTILEQSYRLAYGDWRLRGRSFGMFSVALPSNFIASTVATSGRLLALLFAISTMAVLFLGFVIARRIIRPLEKLVDVSTAVVDGDFERRTNIEQGDEIGDLARSFDIMTNYLVTRNREFAAQASNLNTILNSIADGVVVLGQNGQIVNTNEAAQEILNVTSLSNGSSPTIDPDSALMKAFMADTKGDAITYELGERVYSVLSAPVNDAEQGFLGRVVVLRDVTRETEADRVKDSFITGVSHELRTPLTSVKGYINLLRLSAEENLTPQQQQLVRIADQNADRLIDRVNRIIEIAELQSGTLKLHFERVSFQEIADERAAYWRQRFEEKQIRFEYRNIDDPLWMNGDRPRLAWILDNLLQNAFDYTAQKGRVCLTISKQEDQIAVEVADNGIGIHEADQRHLFTRFFRIQHEPPFDVRGVGLGLFIVNSLVELHQGSVWVESTYGEGSRFGFMIPTAI